MSPGGAGVSSDEKSNNEQIVGEYKYTTQGSKVTESNCRRLKKLNCKLTENIEPWL